MTDAVPRHPDVEIMTAFIDGKLGHQEVAEVATHLRGCADCRTVVTETARLEREVEAAAAPARRPRQWWLAAAAVIALVSVSYPLIHWNARRQLGPIVTLIDAAPADHRVIEPRLTGFPWARLQGPARGEAPPDPADMKSIGAAGEVLQQTAGASSPKERHARGVAYLLSGRPADGVTALAQAAAKSDDAHLWSDLAAARYASASDHAAELPLALAAADRALQLDPALAEAHFNRALILERLGLRDAAARAWRRYLEVDAGGPWSVEAREHLRRLSVTPAAFDRRLFETLPAETVVRRYPRDARAWGEAPLLAEWADAAAAHDSLTAARTLTLVRNLGAALAAVEGEHLLADAVAAIDRATPAQRQSLIDAHRLYRQARMAYSRHNPGAAEEPFRRAADAFRAGGSPMGDMAGYYAASATFDQHRGAEARDALARLLGRIDRSRHPALYAQIEWELAVAANAGGDYGDGARAAEAAAATFRKLGERFNAAFNDGIAAHSYDMIGAADLAWSSRARAFEALSEDRGMFAAALHSAAVTLAAADHTDAAASILNVLIDDVRDNPFQLAGALSTSAELAVRDGDLSAGARSLQAARDAAAHITDAALRESVTADLDMTAAALRRDREPLAAIAMLDRTIALFTSSAAGHLLPEAYLQRALAHDKAGEAEAAAADFAAALAEVEKERDTITDADLRLRFLDVAARIVEGSVEHQLAHGDAVGALTIADHTRRLPGTAPAHDALATPEHGTAAVEYVVLPHAVEIFCVTGAGTSVNRVAIDREVLAERVASFAELIRRRAPVAEVRQEGAALYQLLIAPLQPRLAGIDRLVVVPDRDLYALPFAALYDAPPGRYLAEELAVELAPSLSGARELPAAANQPMLVVADPVTAHWPRLAASREEAGRLAAATGATLLEGAAATRTRFVEEARRAAVIHFAGHADSDAGESYAALLLTPAGGDSGILGAGDVARLDLQSGPLVILAACGTFRGSTAHVAGMPSLARAFLLAGARAVVGTLWEVDDEVSATFFLRLHEHLRTGASPARAVRAAQLEMIHASDARLSDPATWAPVEVLSANAS